MIMIPSDLVSATGFERTLLRAASADPANSGALGNVLGERARRWRDRLASIPHVEVFERVLVRDGLGRTLGDLDVVAVDAADQLLLVFETKWPIDASTLAESYKIDALFDSGRQQVNRLSDAIEAGEAEPVWPRGASVPPMSSARWWVGSAQQLDSRPASAQETVHTTALRLLEHLLPCGSLRELDAKLRFPPLPTRGIEFDLAEQTVRAGRVTIHFPALVLAPGMPTPPPDRRVHEGWT
jgi:hypothetical protein